MSDPRSALERFIRWVTRDSLYLGTYSAVVQLQHDDDTLDLLPDDERVRGTGLSRVPIRHGIPGVRVRVVVGSRVSLGFENGDPRRPYAALWEPGAIELIEIAGGGAEAARKGDSVEVLLPPAIFSGTIGGAPATGVLTFPTGKTNGTIITGSAKLKVGTGT